MYHNQHSTAYRNEYLSQSDLRIFRQ